MKTKEQIEKRRKYKYGIIAIGLIFCFVFSGIDQFVNILTENDKEENIKFFDPHASDYLYVGDVNQTTYPFNAYHESYIICDIQNRAFTSFDLDQVEYDVSYGLNYIPIDFGNEQQTYTITISQDDADNDVFNYLLVQPLIIKEDVIEVNKDTYTDISFDGGGEISLLTCPCFAYNWLDIKLDGQVIKGTYSTDQYEELSSVLFTAVFYEGPYVQYDLYLDSFSHTLSIKGDGTLDYKIITADDWDKDKLVDSKEFQKNQTDSRYNPIVPNVWGMFERGKSLMGTLRYINETCQFNFYISETYTGIKYFSIYLLAGTISELTIDDDDLTFKEKTFSTDYLGLPKYIFYGKLESGFHSVDYKSIQSEIPIDIIFQIDGKNIIIENKDSDLDTDADYLKNSQERALGTRMNVPDSDADGIIDGFDASPLGSITLDKVNMYEFVVPHDSQKNSMFTITIKRPQTDYYTSETEIWNNKIEIKTVPIIRIFDSHSYTKSQLETRWDKEIVTYNLDDNSPPSLGDVIPDNDEEDLEMDILMPQPSGESFTYNFIYGITNDAKDDSVIDIRFDIVWAVFSFEGVEGDQNINIFHYYDFVEDIILQSFSLREIGNVNYILASPDSNVENEIFFQLIQNEDLGSFTDFGVNDDVDGSGTVDYLSLIDSLQTDRDTNPIAKDQYGIITENEVIYNSFNYSSRDLLAKYFIKLNWVNPREWVKHTGDYEAFVAYYSCNDVLEEDVELFEYRDNVGEYIECYTKTWDLYGDYNDLYEQRLDITRFPINMERLTFSDGEVLKFDYIQGLGIPENQIKTSNGAFHDKLTFTNITIIEKPDTSEGIPNIGFDYDNDVKKILYDGRTLEIDAGKLVFCKYSWDVNSFFITYWYPEIWTILYLNLIILSVGFQDFDWGLPAGITPCVVDLAGELNLNVDDLLSFLSEDVFDFFTSPNRRVIDCVNEYNAIQINPVHRAILRRRQFSKDLSGTFQFRTFEEHFGLGLDWFGDPEVVSIWDIENLWDELFDHGPDTIYDYDIIKQNIKHLRTLNNWFDDMSNVELYVGPDNNPKYAYGNNYVYITQEVTNDLLDMAGFPDDLKDFAGFFIYAELQQRCREFFPKLLKVVARTSKFIRIRIQREILELEIRLTRVKEYWATTGLKKVQKGVLGIGMGVLNILVGFLEICNVEKTVDPTSAEFMLRMISGYLKISLGVALIVSGILMLIEGAYNRHYYQAISKGLSGTSKYLGYALMLFGYAILIYDWAVAIYDIWTDGHWMIDNPIWAMFYETAKVLSATLIPYLIVQFSSLGGYWGLLIGLAIEFIWFIGESIYRHYNPLPLPDFSVSDNPSETYIEFPEDKIRSHGSLEVGDEISFHIKVTNEGTGKAWMHTRFAIEEENGSPEWSNYFGKWTGDGYAPSETQSYEISRTLSEVNDHLELKIDTEIDVEYDQRRNIYDEIIELYPDIYILKSSISEFYQDVTIASKPKSYRELELDYKKYCKTYNHKQIDDVVSKLKSRSTYDFLYDTPPYWPGGWYHDQDLQDIYFEFLRPNGDDKFEWGFKNGTHGFDDIDDDVLYPEGQSIDLYGIEWWSDDDGDEVIFDFETFAGYDVSRVDVYIFGFEWGSAGNTGVDISFDGGTNWKGNKYYNFPNPWGEWKSLSWILEETEDDLSEFQVKLIAPTAGANDRGFIEAVYAKVFYDKDNYPSYGETCSSYEGHDNVMKIMNLGEAGIIDFYNPLGASITSGKIEFWVFTNMYTSIQIDEFCRISNNSEIYSLDANGDDNEYLWTLAKNVWNHIKIDFYSGEFDIYVNGLKVGDNINRLYPLDADEISFIFENIFEHENDEKFSYVLTYLDNIDYSWDSGYYEDRGSSYNYDLDDITEYTNIYNNLLIDTDIDCDMDELDNIVEMNTVTDVASFNFNLDLDGNDGTEDVDISLDVDDSLFTLSSSLLEQELDDAIVFTVTAIDSDQLAGVYYVSLELCLTTDDTILFSMDIPFRIPIVDNLVISQNGVLFEEDEFEEIYTSNEDFEKSTVGQNPAGWVTIEYSGQTVNVVQESDAHSKVVEIFDNYGSGEVSITDAIPDVETGIIDFWIMIEGCADNFVIKLDDNYAEAVWIELDLGKIYRFDGSYYEIGEYEINTWYHFIISFDCDDGGDGSNDWHLWIDGESIDEGEGYGFYGEPEAFGELTFWGNGLFVLGYSAFIDAVGYSWNDDYITGDNYYPSTICTEHYGSTTQISKGDVIVVEFLTTSHDEILIEFRDVGQTPEVQGTYTLLPKGNLHFGAQTEYILMNESITFDKISFLSQRCRYFDVKKVTILNADTSVGTSFNPIDFMNNGNIPKFVEFSFFGIEIDGQAGGSADQTKSPTVAASVDRDGKVSWGNPDYIKVEDDSRSKADNIGTDDYSDWIRATDFDFSIPEGSIINGIEVGFDRRGMDTYIKDSSIKLRTSSGQKGDDKATGTSWGTDYGDDYDIYGGSSDLWGTTWTVEEINSEGFGVDLSAYNDNNYFVRDAYVDHVYIKVYYTSPSSDPEPYENQFNIIQPGDTLEKSFELETPDTSVNNLFYREIKYNIRDDPVYRTYIDNLDIDEIHIVFPNNQTSIYGKNFGLDDKLVLDIVSDISLVSTEYSIDDGTPISITGDKYFQYIDIPKTEGEHSIQVFGEDAEQTEYESDKIYFNVDYPIDIHYPTEFISGISNTYQSKETYSFEDDTVGGNPSDLTVVEAGGEVQIDDIKNGKRLIVEMIRDSAGTISAQLDFDDENGYNKGKTSFDILLANNDRIDITLLGSGANAEFHIEDNNIYSGSYSSKNLIGFNVCQTGVWYTIQLCFDKDQGIHVIINNEMLTSEHSIQTSNSITKFTGIKFENKDYAHSWIDNIHVYDLQSGLHVQFSDFAMDDLEYSLDSGSRVDIDGNFVLSYPQPGNHDIIIYGVDIFNDEYSSGELDFTIKHAISNPKNTTYSIFDTDHYPSSDGFDKEEVGTSDTDIKFVSTGNMDTCEIVSDSSSRKNILKLIGNGWDYIRSDWSENKVSGTYEFWVKPTVTNKRIRWIGYSLDDSDHGPLVYFREDGKIYYYTNGFYQVGSETYSANTWYHIRIDFECGAGGYKGLAADKYYLWIDGAKYGPYNFYQNDNLDDLDTLHISSGGDSGARTMYIDAVGYSWDSNYDLGDNYYYKNYYELSSDFESEEIGTTGTNIDFVDSVIGNAGNVEIVAFNSEYKKVLYGYDGAGVNYRGFRNDFSGQSSGTVEYHVRLGETNIPHQMKLSESSGHDLVLKWDSDGNMKYLDSTGWHTIESYSANTWYHVRIEFDCSDDWHLWIDGTSKDSGSGYSFRGTPDSLVEWEFSTYNVAGQGDYWIDSICYSWDDSEYEIGDNKKYELRLPLSFEYEDKIYNWIKYSLDGGTQTEISPGTTSIPMPSNGTHNIQMFFNDGTTHESEKIYFTVDNPIKIDTIEQLKTYSNGDQGYYASTYGFYDDTIGEIPDDWDETIGSGCSIELVEKVGDHKKILYLHDLSSVTRCEIKNDFSASQEYGTVEFWVQTSNANKRTDINLRSSTTENIKVKIDNNNFYAGTTLIRSASDYTWYHIRIDFECGNGEYESLDPDKFYVYIMPKGESQTKYGAYSFSTGASTLSNIYIEGDVTDQIYATSFDAFGYSWDERYSIGYNKYEGKILGFSADDKFNPFTYSFDEGSELTITQDETFIIPLLSGTHCIQIFGIHETFVGKFKSDKIYFNK